jgi:hypothetical protein
MSETTDTRIGASDHYGGGHVRLLPNEPQPYDQDDHADSSGVQAQRTRTLGVIDHYVYRPGFTHYDHEQPDGNLVCTEPTHSHDVDFDDNECDSRAVR